MNVLVCCQNVVYGEGHGRANVEVVLELLRSGHQVTVVADRLSDEIVAHPAVTYRQVNVSSVPTQLLKDAMFFARATAFATRERETFDVVFATGFVLWGVVDVCMVQYVHHAWMESPVHTAKVHGGLYGAYQWLYTQLHMRLESHAFRQARLVVAVSHKIRRELEAIGVPSARIRVLPNGVDAEEFTPGRVDRSAHQLRKDVPLALFVGDIRTPRKNLDTVLRALPQVPEVHLAVAGTVEGSPYPALSDELGVADRVHFLGFRRDVPALMRAADVFVFPSRYEACTLVLLEAMASATPVITAQTAGGAELVTREAGFVLEDPNDVDALADALQGLVNHPARRRAMGSAARVIAERLPWRGMAETYVRWMEELHQTVP